MFRNDIEERNTGYDVYDRYTGKEIVHQKMKEMDTPTAEGKTWLQVAQEIKPDISEELVEYILWNETCYPFDSKIALNQFIEFITTTP